MILIKSTIIICVLLSYTNLKSQGTNNKSTINDTKIYLINERLQYKNKFYLVNLFAEATFGDNWGSTYGAREGKLLIKPEIEIDGLNYVILPKENKSLIQFFNTIWDFFPQMQLELNKIHQPPSIFYCESITFDTFNHPDKWWMNININGTYNASKYRMVVQFNRPEDGPHNEDIIIQKRST
jgi:hypothetical protein